MCMVHFACNHIQHKRLEPNMHRNKTTLYNYVVFLHESQIQSQNESQGFSEVPSVPAAWHYLEAAILNPSYTSLIPM